MAFWVYVIKSVSTGKTYTGYTENLENRLRRHNGELLNKQSSFTVKQGNKDWSVIYKEEWVSRVTAMKREKELKSAKGREFVKNIITPR